MGILKVFKKQKKQADLAQISRAMANVKSLIDLKVISVNMEVPEFSLFPEIWGGKDKKFKTNFCKNVLIWRTVTLGDKHNDRLSGMELELKVFNIETLEQIGTFSKEKGFWVSKTQI